MSEYSQRELHDLRKWYGKWALRYSALHLCLIAALLLGPVDSNFYVLIFLIINAFASHLHLWPAQRAALAAKGETWRINANFYVIIFFYSLTITIVAFPESLDEKDMVKSGLILFLGPFLFMLGNYMYLGEGANND